MKIRDSIKQELDNFYNRIHINDFSSFIKGEFKDGFLLDLSPERAAKNKDECNKLKEWLWRMKQAGVTGEEAVAFAAAEDFCDYIICNSEFYWYKFNITHNTCPLPYTIKRLECFPVGNGREADEYLRLLSQLPEVIDGMLLKLKSQENANITLPPEQIQVSVKMLSGLIQGKDSGLYLKNRLRESDHYYDSIIEEMIAKINKSLHIMILYLENRKENNRKPGLCHLEGGDKYYRALIKVYTSFDYEPQEIQEIGLRELEVTKEKMKKIIEKLGFPGLSLSEFNQKLAADGIYTDTDAKTLQDRYDSYLDKIKTQLDQYFLHKPRAGCHSEPIPGNRETSTSWGYYSVPIGEQKDGIFYYSKAELKKRSQIRTAAIVAHELLPGHHLQTNLISEDTSLPLILSEHFNTAFADGWAEYAADLVYEMGIYNLYDLYGRYMWDLVLCARLVVDTGLNALGWSMEQARAFMKENTNLTDSEIFTETLRYGVDMPGQALAYKMGSLKMHELRVKAETIKKDKFDIKEFHDAVLRYGSIPLYILEANINNYISN